MAPGPGRRVNRRAIIQSVVALVIGFLAAAAAVLFLRAGNPVETANVADGAVAVSEVISLGSVSQDVVVTGFVFIGETRSILCDGRDDADPPFCVGPVIDLVGLDTSRLDLIVAEDAPAYSRDEVTLAGSYRAASLTVSEILQSG